MYFRKYKKWKSSFPFQKSFSFLLIKFNSFPNRKSFYILYLLDISILMKIKKNRHLVYNKKIYSTFQTKMLRTLYIIYIISTLMVWSLTLHWRTGPAGDTGWVVWGIWKSKYWTLDTFLLEPTIMLGPGPICLPPITAEITSIGTGKTMVLLFSAEMLFKVWRYLNWG